MNTRQTETPPTEMMGDTTTLKGRQSVTYEEKTFDPKVYRYLFDNPAFGKLFRFNAEALHAVFHSGKISGERLLDVGTGPVWYGVYEASRWFTEITLSDLSEANLACLRHWKEGNSGDTDNFIKYMLELDGQHVDFEAASQRVAEKVKDVICVDASKEQFLVGTGAEGQTFDAILLTLCQFAATYGYDENLKLVKNYSAYQKQGGYVVVIDTTETTYYTIGQVTYKKCCLPKEQLLTIFESCGYELVSWTESENLYNKSADEAGINDVKGSFVLVCRKIV